MKVLKIDTDQNPELSSQLQVRSITRLDNSISLVADVWYRVTIFSADTRLANHGLCGHGS